MRFATNIRKDIAAGLLGSRWYDLPDLVRDAAGEFVAVMLDTNLHADDMGEAIWAAADAACPIYHDELLRFAADGLGGQWLDEMDCGDMPSPAGVSFVQFLSSAISNVVVYGLRDVFHHMADSLTDDRPTAAEDWQLFGLSEAEAETAAVLARDWVGTVNQLLDAVRALEAVPA